MLDGTVWGRDAAGRIISFGSPLPGYLTGHGTYHATGLLPLLGWAYVALGDTSPADVLVAAGLEESSAAGLRLSQAQWTTLKGTSLARQERWTEAEAAFEDALALCGGIAYPYGEGQVRYEQGRMWRAREEPERARDTFKHALETFRRLGAKPYVALTEAALGEA